MRFCVAFRQPFLVILLYSTSSLSSFCFSFLLRGISSTSSLKRVRRGVMAWACVQQFVIVGFIQIETRTVDLVELLKL